MATTENYGFWYLDPDEEISDFPNQWDYNIDKIDEAIHDASAADDVAASRITGTLAAARIPNLPASKITSGEFAQARIPKLPASHVNTGEFAAARIPDSIARTADVDDETAALDKRITDNADRLDETDKELESHGSRIEELENGDGGGGGSDYESEEVESEVGDGSFLVERSGSVVYISGSIVTDSDISMGTKVFDIPEWALGDGSLICVLPCLARIDDKYDVEYCLIQGNIVATVTDIKADSYLVGSATYLIRS